jgi:hypothetical protein
MQCHQGNVTSCSIVVPFAGALRSYMKLLEIEPVGEGSERLCGWPYQDIALLPLSKAVRSGAWNEPILQLC